MSPIDLPLEGRYLVVVKPDEGVSTREAYGGVKPSVPTVGLREALRRPLDKWQGLVTNDFEQHIFLAHPKIAALKEALLDAGAVYASMSGSGSALFGIFNTPPQLNLDKSIFIHIERL
jgi:4-diphosphocytidyl-2-C-methyl-D-erythritol kinase